MINLVTSIESETNVRFVKAKMIDILKTIQKEAYEPTPGLKMYYQGKLITHFDQSLMEYGINHDTTIEYTYSSYKHYIQTQHAEGYWTDKVLDHVNLSMEDIIDSITQDVKNKISEFDQQVKIVLTWIGIKMLQDKYEEFTDEWKLIVKKGKQFIASNGLKFEDLSFPNINLSL